MTCSPSCRKITSLTRFVWSTLKINMDLLTFIVLKNMYISPTRKPWSDLLQQSTGFSGPRQFATDRAGAASDYLPAPGARPDAEGAHDRPKHAPGFETGDRWNDHHVREPEGRSRLHVRCEDTRSVEEGGWTPIFLRFKNIDSSNIQFKVTTWGSPYTGQLSQGRFNNQEQGSIIQL